MVLRKIGVCLLSAVCGMTGAVALADPPLEHYMHAGVMVPGAIGTAQLQRGGPLAGYYQPVEVRAPRGVDVSVAVENQFTQPQRAPLKAALLIGSVYRLRVTGIPHREGEEVYPTIELINRLYPPCGEELRFPIPIELTQEDLEAAMDGKFVTRVIYLENPRAAYPHVEDPNMQITLEASPKEDPLVMADHLGRPMAIVRIGGRVPLAGEMPDEKFMYNSPPLIRFAPASVPLVGSLQGLPQESTDVPNRMIFDDGHAVPIAPPPETAPEPMTGPSLTR